MPFDPPHISNHLLARYLLKDVTETETEACEEHILGCPACAICAEEAMRLLWALDEQEHMHTSGGLQLIPGVRLAPGTVPMITTYARRRVAFNWRYYAAAASLAAATFVLGVWLGTSRGVAPLVLMPYVAAARTAPPAFPPFLPSVQPVAQPRRVLAKRAIMARISKQHHYAVQRRRVLPPVPMSSSEPKQIVLDVPGVILDAQLFTPFIPMETPDLPAYQRRRPWVVRLFTAVRKSLS
jgi:hypothetical protein